MQTREEIANLVLALNEASLGSPSLRLREEEYAQLEAILQIHPDIWPTGLADTFQLFMQKLRFEEVDRQAIPKPLIDFFDDKYQRDLDPMALARHIGHEIRSSCEECGCKC